jgi:uncharacterized membrane protein YkvA (DUF1232 family)
VTIEAYLAELRRRLPSTGSRRFLAEVEAHLRDATGAQLAQGIDRAEAEAQAIEAFGPADVVAARMWRETVPIAVRRASGVALLALGLLVLPLYLVPENLLPPAPWEQRPGYLGVLLVTALATWIVASVLAVMAFVAPGAYGAYALVLAAGLALVSGAAGLAAGVAWHLEAPATPWSITAICLPLTVIALAGVGAAAAWARSRALAMR